MTLLGFGGWELVGFALWTGAVIAVWQWARQPRLTRSDRQFARRHRL